ncbi:hypothetical protein PFMC_00114 [Plasmodium falciparum CAMP/Malaysia]|uniref:Uncharacterized protein n=1 Tax=Plasmodium falciparum (isolate Camp / Malaysia) TaxID=5835 RepID=A0A024XFQ3_PLAFC|nr:hypothetical protein PFMC_00114 [Plasmodium falciparum CAMP/Malaysia]
MEQIGIANNIFTEIGKNIVKRSGPFEIWRKKFIEEVSKKISNSLNIENIKECKKNCRKINYWMDDKEEEFVSKKFFVYEYITSNVWKNEFEKAIINTLKNKTKTCLRSRKKYPKEIRNIMGELEDYIDAINDYKKQFKNLYCWSERYIDYKKWLNEMKEYFIKHKEWKLLNNNKYRMYIIKYLKRSLGDMFPSKIECIKEIPDINEEVVKLSSEHNTHMDLRSSYKKKGITLKTSEFVKEKIKSVNDRKEKKIPVSIKNEHVKKNYFWKWITIIEIHLLIIEDIRKEEWKMTKEDFLFICINEFVNEKDKKCLYNEEDDFDSTKVMIKGQSFLWNRWMERQTYMLDKYKEEEPFEYLKSDWKREEDEYMKKIYKELLISLRGDTYYMSQKQKIIWRRWVAKHPYRIREKRIDEWFDKLFEEINKNGIISDDVIDILLNDYKENVENDEYIYDMIEKRKKLKLILWIKIYMYVWEEVEKDKWKSEKEMFIDTYINKLKDKKEYDEVEYDEVEYDEVEYDEKKNKELIKLLNDMKKMEILNTDDEKRKEWKEQDWFKQMRKEWIREESRYLNEINEEILGNYNMELQKYRFEKHYEDIKLKWIDDIDGDNNNDNGWFPIIKYFEGDNKEGKNYITKEYSEKKYYVTNTLYDIENIKNDTLEGDKMKEKFNVKTIIEIHMVIIEDFQKDEWKKDKGDFLQICFEEFIKRKEFNEEGENKIIIDNKEKKSILNISDDNVINILQNSWSEWFKRHTYILDKWKEEEWFKDLKNDWKREEYEYIKKIYKDLLLSLRGDTYYMSQKQKIIWRQWISKHLYYINEDMVTKWFKDILEQLDRGNIIDLLYIENEINKLNEENGKNFLGEEQLIYDKKKILTTILWIQIHMMVLEESKKDECTKSKEMFLDTCIDELKKDEKENKKTHDDDEKTKEIIKIVEDMKKMNNLEIDEHRSTKWKKQKWFKEMKKDWIYVKDRYLLNLEENHKYDVHKCEELIDGSSLDLQKNISKWNWENIQFKWIDYENEKDWLKGDHMDIDEDTNEYMYEDIEEGANEYIYEYIRDNIEKDTGTNVDEEHIKKYEECHDFVKIKDPFIWKNIIEIQLKIMEESKREKWEKNKYDFLEICIQEYIKNEHKDNNSRNLLEDEIFSMDKNMIWDTFIEAHRYILEKWKREEWFHNLKNEWNVEVLNYLNQSENKNDEKRICMIEKEKNIFRKWINKHTEELNDCYEDEKNPFLEEDMKKKKKLILTAWIQIHMMILERLKEDECLANKHLFIDAYIEEFKRDKHKNKYNKKIIDMLENMKKNIYHTNLNNDEINEWKNETWFNQWKDDWIKEENENEKIFWLAQMRKERCAEKKYEKKDKQKEKNMNEYNNIGQSYMHIIHKNLLKKYLKYIKFK